MTKKHCFTEEEKAELLSNPYTARITDYQVVFTLAFKQFVIKSLENPGLSIRHLFEQAGYRPELFNPNTRKGIVRRIREEAASPEGLREPLVPKKPQEKKKHRDTEIKELQERVALLEQQISFLKKSQLLKTQDRLSSQDNSN